MAGIPGCVGSNGWRHTSPHGQQRENGRARSCLQLYCSFVQYTSKMFGWREEGNTRYAPRCPCGGSGKIAFVFPAQFIAVCRRSKIVAMGTRSARRGSRLYRRWALKWREEGQLLGQYLRATKCDKLSVGSLAKTTPIGCGAGAL